MGNQIGKKVFSSSFLFVSLAVLLVALFAQPAEASTRNRLSEQMRMRLCERQMMLGHRLSRPLIDPDICNPPAPEEPTLEFTATPGAINSGASSLLEWDTDNATECTASGGWSGDKEVSDSESVTPSSTTTYTLMCGGPGGFVTKSVTVTVNTVNPEPTLTFSGNPLTVHEGSLSDATSTLTWDSTNADSCTASNGWTGSKGADGSAIVTPIGAASVIYTLTCTGAGGSVAKDVTITVVPPQTQTATLKVLKTVVNDNNGTKVASDFQAKIDGTNVAWDSAQTLSAGAHTASEAAVTGYTAGSWGGDCAANGTITLAAGDVKTCTITNDDQAAVLHVKKVVINDNNGTKVASDFSFQVNDGVVTAFEADTQNDVTVNAGTYSVTEPAVSGYTASMDNCTNVILANGGEATCTITNNDNAPTTATLKLVKLVTNDNNGTAVASDFQGKIDGTNTAWDSAQTLAPGLHTASEDAHAGYTAGSWGGDCAADGTITLAAGDVKTCTITNNDQPGTLHVKKIVINDSGKTKVFADFSFQVDGGPPVSFDAVDGQNDLTVNAGTYNVTEPSVAGYASSTVGCTNIVIPNGGEATCTITNDDIAAPTATLTADSTTLSAAGNSTLTWSSVGATSCTASNNTSNADWTGTLGAVSGSKSILVSQTTIFTLSCTGLGGDVTTQETVTVTPQ